MLLSVLTNVLDNQLTLGELLDAPGFGLKLLTVGPQARRRLIHGAHSIEVSGPARWLPEHWVMLTTGVRLRARPAEQRSLIADLVEGGIAALGFGIGVVSKQVPGALLEEARKRSFPVFTVPFDVPFREIELFVNRSLISTDLYVLQRVVSMQDYLMDAFHEEPPEPVLLKRLASVLRGAEVALVESDGTVIAATGANAAAAWAKARRKSRLHELEYAGRWGVAARVDRANRSPAWLIVLTAGEDPYRQLVKPVTRAAARLLEVPSLARDSAAWRLRRRRRLAAILHDPSRTARGARFYEALADAGLDLATPCRVVLFGDSSDGDETEPLPEQVLDRVEDLLDTHQVAHVSSQVGRTVFTFAQDELESLGAWLESADKDSAVLCAGIGEPVTDLNDVERSLFSARIALSELRQQRQIGRVVRYESLDPLTLLLTSPDGSAVRHRFAACLEPLTAETHLLETLEAYYAADLSVPRAARALRIHPNSLRYRLGRIEQIVRLPLSSPRTVAILYLALLDRRLPPRPHTVATAGR
jgi:purine catabolism regulator